MDRPASEFRIHRKQEGELSQKVCRQGRTNQSLDPLLPKFLRDFADLSIACMAADSDDRPAGDDILKKLHTIWTQSTMDEEERDNDEELEPYITKCLQGRRCQVPVDQGGLLSLLAILLAI
jgi:hypothetical protein